MMDIEKLKAEFEKLKYVEDKLEYLNFDEHLGCYVEKNNGMPVGLAAWVNGALYGFEQAAKSQAVPEGFLLVSSKELLDLTVAINAVDLATHTDNKTNEVREMWQDIAIKLSKLGEDQEQSHDSKN